MDIPSISPDDVTDVMEMTQNLEVFIADVLDGNAHNLALSALMGATINCVLEQCETLDEVVLYRNIFIQMPDDSIKRIKIKNPEQPS